MKTLKLYPCTSYFVPRTFRDYLRWSLEGQSLVFNTVIFPPFFVFPAQAGTHLVYLTFRDYLIKKDKTSNLSPPLRASYFLPRTFRDYLRWTLEGQALVFNTRYLSCILCLSRAGGNPPRTSYFVPRPFPGLPSVIPEGTLVHTDNCLSCILCLSRAGGNPPRTSYLAHLTFRDYLRWSLKGEPEQKKTQMAFSKPLFFYFQKVYKSKLLTLFGNKKTRNKVSGFLLRRKRERNSLITN